ncbi:Ig-like domain-containing protein [Tropicibacter oceani]|uniref:Ig-like domain-containing protein n=1 Tax=Tropicibacter oceani TaxID=3058420 RepID=A0ABY8QI57_9RHOB|nr:Ig-like domain-containing protein [Tropicibacter oceani]WGW03668.1 Ig-like domain-containing protein [Tropicibacter oceani]
MKFLFGLSGYERLLGTFMDTGGKGGGPSTGWHIFGNGSKGSKPINGTNADDTLTGTTLADKISGKNGDDTIFGLAGDDNLDGNNGDDVIEGGEGDDDITGNNGFDTAVYGGSILDFSFSAPSGGANTTTVTDLNTADGDEGTDVLKHVEAIQFNDFLYLIGQDNAPMVIGNGGTTTEDSAGTFVVTAYEFDGDALLPPAVTYAGPGTVSLVSTTPLSPAIGVGATYTFEFDPDGQFETLADGQSAVQSVQVEVTDANGTASVIDVDVTVTGVNDAPVAVDDTAETDEDTGQIIDVLGNDSDIDNGDTFGVTDASALNGSVVIQGDGTLLYTPDPDFNGSDTITYEITDGGGLTDTATVAVTVNPVNDAPVAADDTAETDEDTGKIIDVLGNDTDVDIGDSLTVTDASALNGSVVIQGDGTLLYTPDPDFNGSDTITYEITDGGGLTDTATVAVTVNPVNDAPVAADDTAETDEDTGKIIDVLGNDTDVDIGDSLTVTDASALNGSVVIQGDGTLLYTPDPDFNGSDTITYEITDGGGLTDTATVAVTVNPVNDAPRSLEIPLTINEADGVQIIDLGTQAFDPDGDGLSFDGIALTRDSKPIPFQVVGDGLIRIDPARIPGLGQGDSLDITFRYIVTDDSGAPNDSAVGFVPVTINGIDDAPPPANSAPVAAPLVVVADEENGPVAIKLSEIVSDPDVGDILTITSLTWDSESGPIPVSFSGGLTGGDGGELSFDPAFFGLEEGETAVFSLTYVVEDAEGLTASNVITLELAGDTPGAGNTPPVATSLPIQPPFSTAPPAQIIVDDPLAPTFTVNLFDLVSDAETPDGDLVITIGGLEIGFDESTGDPILADGALSYDALSGDLTIDLTAIPVADGSNLVGTIDYQVSDGEDVAKGQLVYDYVNPADGPTESKTVVLDFEEFAWTDPEFQGPVPGSMGFTFSGVATAVETDELGGDGRTPTGIQLGQTTDGGDNVVIGTYSTITTVTEVLDEEGQPIKDEAGNPVVEVVETPDDPFGILAPGLAFGIGGEGQFLTTTTPGQTFPVPEDLGESFDLNALSVNPASGGQATVTITLYTIGVVELPSTTFAGFSDYSYTLVEVDSFEFVIDSSTEATQIDFEASDFGIGAVGANTTPEAFDDIHAVQITTDSGVAVVIDDAIMTV